MAALSLRVPPPGQDQSCRVALPVSTANYPSHLALQDGHHLQFGCRLAPTQVGLISRAQFYATILIYFKKFTGRFFVIIHTLAALSKCFTGCFIYIKKISIILLTNNARLIKYSSGVVCITIVLRHNCCVTIAG